jgi:acetoin utilization deacetylase AcuC-like enzyme
MKFLLDKICLEHYAGYGHPEQPLRIKKILDYFNLKGLNSLITSENRVNNSDLQRILRNIHSDNLIKRVESSKNNKETYFDQDTQANDKTYQIALQASSLAITAGKISTVDNSVFSLMRPPGHHATPERIMGFCFFNNIALATQNLLEKHKKIVIIDFDFHYGNGTADIFWTNPNVLYISIHADPSVNFPNQGFIDEIGSKEGKGYNICIPLTFSAGNNELLYSIQQLILPVLYDFNPDYLAISAGFDGFYEDPVGGGYLQYDTKGYNEIGKFFYNYSKETKTPIFHVLEGGYNTEELPKLIHAYISPWMNKNSDFNTELKSINPNLVKSREKKTIEYLKQMLQPYWNLK